MVSNGGNSLTREERSYPFRKWIHVPGQEVWGKEPNKTLKREKWS